MRHNWRGLLLVLAFFGGLLVGCQSEKKEAPKMGTQVNPHQTMLPPAQKMTEKQEAQMVRKNLDGFLSFGDSLAVYPVWKEKGPRADTLKALIKKLKKQGQELRELAKGKDDHALVVTFSAYHNTIRDFMKEFH